MIGGRDSPLVERDAELGLLDGLAADAAAGRARIAVVEGPAGTGKSRPPGLRDRRLLPGRRHRVARPAPRDAGEQRHGDRSGHRRRRPGAGRRGREPDPFWALRGGGGNFGVVTAIEFRVLPLPEVYGGALVFPVARSGDVLDAWNDLLPSLPWRTPWSPSRSAPADASAFWDAATWRRLRAVKAAYDPEDRFRGNHHIPPAGWEPGRA